MSEQQTQETQVVEQNPVVTVQETAPDPKETELRERFDIPEGISSEGYARMLGWVPKEEYRGDPTKWRPAEQFIEYGQQNRLVLKGEVRKLSTTVSEQQRIIDEQKAAIAEFTKFMNGTNKAIAERQRENLLAQKVEALKNSDHQSAVLIDEQLRKMDQPQVVETKPEPKAEDPVVTNFKRDNRWYTDPDKAYLAAEFNRTVAGIVTMGVKGQSALDQAMKVMKKNYPEEFGTPRSFSAVDGGGTATTSSARTKAKTFENLPKEVQDTFNKTLSRHGVSKEGYTQRYYEINGDKS